MRKSYIKQILSYSMVGSLGFTVVASLQGCGESQDAAPQQGNNAGSLSDAAASEQGLFLVIQQTGVNPDTYELQEKYPSSSGTRAILKDMEGNERVLDEAELQALAEAEAQRVEEGSSQLSQPVAENQGLSLGETILASAAGALIGGMIANKLMGNSNFQQHQQQQARRAQTSISRPAAGGTDTRAVNQNQKPKSGFFGNNSGNANPSNRSSGSAGSSSSFGG